jgi:hypothetical protein
VLTFYETHENALALTKASSHHFSLLPTVS